MNLIPPNITPGDWRSHNEGLMPIDGKCRRAAVTIEGITSTGFQPVAIVTDMKPREFLPSANECVELEANARAIAAVPTMLAALNTALSVIEELPYPQNYPAAELRAALIAAGYTEGGAK